MAYIHLYRDSVQISEGDSESNPLSIGPLNATNNESSAATALVIKCETGYVTTGDTVVSFVGTNAAKWTVCATADGTYAATLTISTAIDATTGTTIYVKAASSSDETPANDTGVNISLTATIAAA